MRFRALNLYREKVEKESLDKQFLDIALLYRDVPYKWGKETMEGVDCSGLIAGTLNFMGFPIRTTAHQFMLDYFTKDTDAEYKRGKLKLGFLVSKNTYFTHNDVRPAGMARHVFILIGDGIVYHAVSPGAKFEKLDVVLKRYSGSNVVFREADWKAIKEAGHVGIFDEDLR